MAAMQREQQRTVIQTNKHRLQDAVQDVVGPGNIFTPKANAN